MGVLMSRAQTCRAMDINAPEYLEDILRRINGHPQSRLNELPPATGSKQNHITIDPLYSFPPDMYQQ